MHTYQDIKESQRAIFEYIESWYNRKRIHSAIDYMTPQQKEDEELRRAA
nr:IS3 family transposase [Cuneatibacter sp. NSJ-177]